MKTNQRFSTVELGIAHRSQQLLDLRSGTGSVIKLGRFQFQQAGGRTSLHFSPRPASETRARLGPSTDGSLNFSITYGFSVDAGIRSENFADLTAPATDRKITRLNSSHANMSY